MSAFAGDRRQGLFDVAAVVSLAFAVRLAYLLQIRSNPFFCHPIVEGRMYDQLAQRIAGGDLVGSGVFNQAPLYAYFLGLLYRVFGHDYFLARLVQIALGAATCALILAVGRKVFTRRVGLIAGLIGAVYGTLVFYDGELIRPFLLNVLSLSALLALLKARESPGFGRWAAAGLLLGLAAITWELVLPFIPVALAWMFVSLKYSLTRAQIARRGTAFGLAAVIVIVPVTVRNYLVSGDLVLISGWGGLNFFLGNNPDTHRMTAIQPGEEWDELVDLPARAAGVRRPSLRSRWFYGEALRFIRENPLAWLGGLGKKLLLFWNAAEVEPNNDLAYFRERSSVFRALYQPFWLVVAPFGVVGPLALLGLALAPARDARARLLLCFVLTLVLAMTLYHVRARYRITVVPVLIVFAAWALERLREGLAGAWSRRRAAAGAAALLSLTALVNTDFFSLRGAAIFPLHTTLGKVHLESGRLDLAREEFLKAVETRPDDHDALVNLGVLREREGRGTEALELFERAIRAKPGYAVAHNDVGVWHFTRGRLEPAVAALRKAVSLKPDYADARYNLGIAYLALKDRARAAEQFRAALEIDPEHAAARRAYDQSLEMQ